MFNQLAGINAILYYLNDIFARAGFTKVSGDLQAVAIGFTNLVFTMLAMSIIDRVGRRTLMLIGSVGTALCLAGVALIFYLGSYEWSAGLAADRLHRLLRVLARGGHLGLHQRGVPNRCPRERSEPRQLHALDDERHHRVELPRHRGLLEVSTIRVFAAMMALQFFVVLTIHPETTGIALEDMDKRLRIH